MLKKITLLRERVKDWAAYPFSVPTIATLPEIEIHSRIVFFAGENGSGKSTLLEAIAGHYGFGPEGGNRNLQFETSESSRSVERLTRALRLSFNVRTGKGFYFRAEAYSALQRRSTNGTRIQVWDEGSSIATAGSHFITILMARLSLRFLTTSSEIPASSSSTNRRQHSPRNANFRF